MYQSLQQIDRYSNDLQEKFAINNVNIGIDIHFWVDATTSSYWSPL